MEQVKRKLEECLAKFREDKLTEQDLLQAIESVESTNRKEKPAQRLLYLQAENTSSDYGFGSAQQHCRQTDAGEEAHAGDGRPQSHELLGPPCAEHRGEQCGRQRRQYGRGQGGLRDSA